MSTKINVLVNGRNCKQYNHNGKIFVESKHGSEYEIEIQNNNYYRVLAVVSIDGLSVMDGKSASDESSGYIVNANDILRIKGWRRSNEDVGAFQFTKKETSYAESKGVGAEKNCGVIGVKIYDELVRPVQPPVVIHVPVIVNTPVPVPIPTPYPPPFNPWDPWYTITSGTANYCGTSSFSPNSSYTSTISGAISSCCNTSTPDPTGGLYGEGKFGYSNKINSDLLKEAIADAKTVRMTALANPKSAKISADRNSLRDRFNRIRSTSANVCTRNFESPGVDVRENDMSLIGCDSAAFEEEPIADFDMGTNWGQKKDSKVVKVDFEKGCLVFSTDIYYASRQSLINMGVPLDNKQQVGGWPQSFEENYATPPSGWRG